MEVSMGKPTDGYEQIIKEVLENGAADTAKVWMDAILEDNGRVPLIFERMAERPEVLISHLLYKTAVLKTSTLTPKYVELISIAVSSALRCNYCTDYHIQAAIRKGATKDEVLEAILIAGLTSQSTVLADAYRTYGESIEECTPCAMRVPEKVTDPDDGKKK
jgi:AhpD family alkylhydroperoxidase